MLLVQCEILSVSSRIWTRVAVSISYDDNHYTTGTSSPFIDLFVQSSMLAIPLPSFLDTYILFMSSFRCRTLRIVINFFVLWSIWIIIIICLIEVNDMSTVVGYLMPNLFLYKSSSSSSLAASTDIPDPLSPLLLIVHRFW